MFQRETYPQCNVLDVYVILRCCACTEDLDWLMCDAVFLTRLQESIPDVFARSESLTDS